MRHYLIFLFCLLSLSSFSQMCNTAPTNMGGLTMTTAWQNVTGASTAKRYWTFNATAGCTYDFSTCNSLFTNDTYLRLYSGTNPLTAVLQTSNDDNGPFCTSTKASLSWVCPTTGAYSILVTNYSCANLSASTILSYRQTCSPPYNPCLTIPSITCGTSNNLVVSSGNGIYNPPSTTCGFSTPGKEYIYSFTPTITGNYTISQPTSFGYIDWFFKSASGGCNGTGWTCIDDITNANTGNANVNIALTSGVTYYIMADPESTTGGNVTWTLNCPTLPPPNDNCSNAIAITTLPYNSPVTSNNPATDDVPTSPSGCSTQGSNVWYTVIGNGNEFTATTCNASTNFDTEVRVYTGNCGALNSMAEVVCNDDDATCGSGTLKSTVTWCTSPSVIYYISVGYYASGPGYGNFVLSVLDGPSCLPLPITLLSFEGHLENNSVILEWSTATEHNNDYFYIERSNDGFTWSKILQVPAVGNSSTKVDYLAIDDSPRNGNNYYRLTQVDYDGQKETFDIIVVSLNSKNDNCVGKYYDMTGKEVDITTCSSGVYIKVCDTGSKLVRKL